jgi:hypothetical protein
MSERSAWRIIDDPMNSTDLRRTADDDLGKLLPALPTIRWKAPMKALPILRFDN